MPWVAVDNSDVVADRSASTVVVDAEAHYRAYYGDGDIEVEVEVVDNNTGNSGDVVNWMWCSDGFDCGLRSAYDYCRALDYESVCARAWVVYT